MQQHDSPADGYSRPNDFLHPRGVPKHQRGPHAAAPTLRLHRPVQTNTAKADVTQKKFRGSKNSTADVTRKKFWGSRPGRGGGGGRCRAEGDGVGARAGELRLPLAHWGLGAARRGSVLGNDTARQQGKALSWTKKGRMERLCLGQRKAA